MNLEGDTPTTLRTSITSGKKLVKLCTFSVRVSQDGSGRTNLRLGGLDNYRTQQQRLLMVIPAGPKPILGMAPYKRFLEVAAELISDADPSAELTISSSP